MFTTATLAFAFLSLSLTFAAPTSIGVTELLKKNNFTAFVDALVKYNAQDVLSSNATLTIFAPTNEVFNAIVENKKTWMENSTMFKKYLQYHVVQQKIMPADIRNEMTATAVTGDRLRFNLYGPDKKIMTVNGVMFMEPQIVTPDVIIYKLNSVLMCSLGGGIVDTLQRRKKAQGRFSTLIKAIQVANLTDTLEKGGPFTGLTLFAPTNDAFSALPAGELDKLLATPVDLKKILLGHVANGTYFLSGLLPGDLPTLDGGSNKIAVGNAVTVDGAKINLEADMLANNGVIHIIDRVLL